MEPNHHTVFIMVITVFRDHSVFNDCFSPPPTTTTSAETHMQIYLDTVIIIPLIGISLGISECTVKVQVAMDTLVLKYGILKWCCLPTTYIITGP